MVRALRVIRRILSIGLVGLFIWVLAPDGAVNHYASNARPQKIERYSGTSESKTAFVFFTGVQSSGTAHSAPLRDLWSKHGDVIVVEYNRNRFDGRVTAYDLYRQLIESGYQRAILDGASMGGLLATDVIDLDRAQGNRLKFAVMMQDVPQDRYDLYQTDQAEAMATLWYPGPVTNRLGTGLFWHFGFHPPERYMLGGGVDETQLREHYAASGSYPLSGWVGEIRYIIRHRGFERNQYVGIPLVIMQSEKDGVVRPTADKWKLVFGGGTVIQVPETTHVGFVEYPDRWRVAYQKGFEALPPGW